VLDAVDMNFFKELFRRVDCEVESIVVGESGVEIVVDFIKESEEDAIFFGGEDGVSGDCVFVDVGFEAQGEVVGIEGDDSKR